VGVAVGSHDIPLVSVSQDLVPCQWDVRSILIGQSI